MFDCLLGGKFSNKCKHSVKCIYSRIVPIRKKKQARLRFFKEDVAQLLSNGHDTNAFGRIEALIIEINHTSCYDMIEQYCECILKQLPSLQKQRECPEEAMEAVSTLIFAAARFSDLQELCDLRRVFTERYGSHMESSVNAEFVDKMQKSSFPMDKKLQLMQDIAQEFSVRWDSKAFQQKMSNPHASASDQHKRGSETNEQRSHAKIDGMNEAVKGRKEAVINADGDQVVPSKERWEPPPRNVMQKQQVQLEPRDIHVIPSVSNGHQHDLAEKTRKMVSAADDESENVEPCYHNPGVPPYVKPKGTENGTHKDDRLHEGTARNRSPRAHEGPGRIGLERQSVGPVISRDVKAVNMIPPYTYTKSKGGVTVARYVGPAYDELRKVEGLNPTGQERRPTKQANPYDDRPVNMIPPYTKPKFRNPSALADDSKLTDEPTNSSSTAEYDRSNGDERPKPFSVSRKQPRPPMVVETDNVIDDAKPTSRTPRVRRKEGRQINDDLYGEEEKIMDRYPKQTAAEQMDGAGSHEWHVSRTPRGRRRHGGRRSTASYDGDCDEEEEFMDRLLVHYSKKGMSTESGKTKTRMRAPPRELVVDAGRVGDNHHHNNGNGIIHPGPMHHRPERVASLPPELTSPVAEIGVVKGPIRATSMQHDMLSPNRGRVHPRLPDYDELAARFIALRKA